MEAWLGQYCVYVTDIERTIGFYEALGLTCTSRTEIPNVHEAILENPGKAKSGRIQLAQKHDQQGPIDMGNAFWKLYVNTNDMDRIYQAALEAGAQSNREPARAERWPVTVGFVKDPDGYLVELVQRHPWQDGDDTTYSWLGQYCIYVSDIAATTKFYETLGLTRTSETDLGTIKECILENPEKGGKVQLAQKLGDTSPIEMGGAMWKLYVNTADCEGLHRAAVDAGYTSVMEPRLLERWDTTVAFVEDPDGYQVELVTLPRDR